MGFIMLGTLRSILRIFWRCARGLRQNEMTDTGFDAEEKAAIVAEWKRLHAEPPPFNPRPVGCAVFLLAGALLLLIPQLSRWLGVALPSWMSMVSAVLVLLLVVGFFCGVFLGSGVYGRAVERARESLEWLASHPGLIDAAARRRHAVSLIANAVVSDGPTSSNTIDIAEATVKLGANLQYVVAVERVLAAEKLSAVYFGEA